MKLGDAIAHAKEVAEKSKKNAEHIRDVMSSEIALSNAIKCEECAAEHEQLAAWLEELAERREVDKNLEELADFWKDSLFGDGIRFALKAIDDVKKRDWEREDK